MNKSKSYYFERFSATIMNRLVESESNSLLEQYNMYKKDIEDTKMAEIKKAEEMKNLKTAYKFVRMYLSGTEELSLIS